MLELQQIASSLRKDIFRMIYIAGGGHMSPAFSAIDIMTALYFGGILKYHSNNPYWEERDRFILSKGHASAALYVVLARAGFIEREELNTFCKSGTRLGGHPKMHDIPGVEASTGALGHGLAFGTGIALAGKINKKDYKTIVMLGDGECQEGSIWESVLFAFHQKLGNLIAIVDYNKLQAMDKLDNIIGMEPFVDKWRAFGWNVHQVDGHNISEIIDILGRSNVSHELPTVVIAHTIKGKGVSFMENAPLWHYRMPNPEELTTVLNELNISKEELLKI
jgi:transketolase